MSSAFGSRVFLASTLSLIACTPSWHAGRGVLAAPEDVAAALGDPPPAARADLTDLPVLAPPHHARFCCAFGMDLRVDFAGLDIPFFEVGNVIDVDALDVHHYDVPDGAIDGEANGLVYTCRGGWIDTAHVRENADTMLFLTLRIARGLRQGTTIEIADHGAATRIVVAPIAETTLRREGALDVASRIAAWATFRMSVWHEVSTWYGYESVSGFSEQPSAFSPEDLYSNVLGIHLARAAIAERAFATADDWNVVIAAFLRESLVQLGAQPRGTSRAIMAALDGRWWSSLRRLPDNHLVTRRFFPTDAREIRPWRAEDAFEEGEVPAFLTAACDDAQTRSLTLATHVAGVPMRDLVVITWAPEAWADARFPFEDANRRVVDERELDRLVADAHDGLRADLGPGFDSPRPLTPIAPLETTMSSP